MEDLLFLCHRLPLPPDRGDRIRMTHVLRHLAGSFRVHLGCLIDTPDAAPYLPQLRALCASVAAIPAAPLTRAVRAAARLRPGQALSSGWFAHPELDRYVDATTARVHPVATYIYGATMFPARPPGAAILDMVECDSDKWDARAASGAGPVRALWRREARALRALEATAARRARATLFVSAADAEAFRARHPDLGATIDHVENGVDAAYFSPSHRFPSPFAAPGPHIVFTASFDYWPNDEAARWFAAEVLPRLRGRPVLHLVGAAPSAALRRLARAPDIAVTGRVADIRPYLAYADLAVAPLLWARGLQNKVLEAMAMGRPTVVSGAAFQGLRAEPGRDLLVADGAAAMAAAIGAVLDGAHPGLGAAGRDCVASGYGWATTLGRLDAVLGRALGGLPDRSATGILPRQARTDA